MFKGKFYSVRERPIELVIDIAEGSLRAVKLLTIGFTESALNSSEHTIDVGIYIYKR